MKSFVKALLNGLAAILVFPAVVIYRVGSLFLSKEQAFPGWSQAFSLIPGLTGVYLRRAFYRQVLPRCDKDACVSFGTIFSHPTAEIGKTVYVGTFCCLGDVTLDDDVLLGSNVSVMNGSGQHGIERLDIPIREQPGVWPRIHIGRDTWIGNHSVIMANVGKHCVIGAGSVVIKPIPDYAVAVGAPAKVIRLRTDSHEPVQEEQSSRGAR